MGSIPVEVVYGTSSDPARPPSHSISQKSFWVTTGTFPQILVVKLERPSLVARVKLYAFSLYKILVEGSVSETGDSFTSLGEAERFPDSWKSTDISLLLTPRPVHYLRFVLESGPRVSSQGVQTAIRTSFSALRGLQILAN